MSGASGPQRRILQDLRRSLGSTAALVDAILLGGAGDFHDAMHKLPAALALLSSRTQQAIEAMARDTTA